ncbi:Metacaspase-1 [Diplonema papillatum]|nr:Metacaspase-1 [Diplonema papillatum]
MPHQPSTSCQPPVMPSDSVLEDVATLRKQLKDFDKTLLEAELEHNERLRRESACDTDAAACDGARCLADHSDALPSEFARKGTVHHCDGVSSANARFGASRRHTFVHPVADVEPDVDPYADHQLRANRGPCPHQSYTDNCRCGLNDGHSGARPASKMLFSSVYREKLTDMDSISHDPETRPVAGRKGSRPGIGNSAESGTVVRRAVLLVEGGLREQVDPRSIYEALRILRTQDEWLAFQTTFQAGRADGEPLMSVLSQRLTGFEMKRVRAVLLSKNIDTEASGMQPSAVTTAAGLFDALADATPDRLVRELAAVRTAAQWADVQRAFFRMYPDHYHGSIISAFKTELRPPVLQLLENTLLWNGVLLELPKEAGIEGERSHANAATAKRGGARLRADACVKSPSVLPVGKQKPREASFGDAIPTNTLHRRLRFDTATGVPLASPKPGPPAPAPRAAGGGVARAPAEEFPVGCSVVLHGLRSRTDLNAATAVVVALAGTRRKVRTRAEVLVVKTGNLVRVNLPAAEEPQREPQRGKPTPAPLAPRSPEHGGEEGHTRKDRAGFPQAGGASNACPRKLCASCGDSAAPGAGGKKARKGKPTHGEDDPQRVHPRCKALLIGCSYESSGLPRGERCPFQSGNARSVFSVRRSLAKHTVSGRAVVLADAVDAGAPSQLPTLKNIRKGLAWLVNGAAPADILFLYFCGHTRSSLQEADGADKPNGLVPCDYQSQGALSSTEIETILAAVPSGVSVCCVFDCPQVSVKAGTRPSMPILIRLPFQLRSGHGRSVRVSPVPSELLGSLGTTKGAPSFRADVTVIFGEYASPAASFGSLTSLFLSLLGRAHEPSYLHVHEHLNSNASAVTPKIFLSWNVLPRDENLVIGLSECD